LQEHGRYDLGFEIAGELLRVQCKWGALDREGRVIRVTLRCSSCTPAGYVHSEYRAGEIDLVAVYCEALDQCYLIPAHEVVGMKAVYLRCAPTRNGQRASINLATEYEFAGAVAQLEERRAGSAKAGGSSPPSSTSSTPAVVETGAHQFRNHFGYYMERAAAGEEIHVARRGKPYVRLLPAEGTLQLVA
jgi:prevent-host-death family protein